MDWREREFHELPRCRAVMDFVAKGDPAVELRLRSYETPCDVPVQIAFDFPAGGLLVLEGGAFRPEPGQRVIFSGAKATYSRDGHLLHLSPGGRAHETFEMRDTLPPQPGCWRLIVLLLTPVDHTMTIRSGVGPWFGGANQTNP